MNDCDNYTPPLPEGGFDGFVVTFGDGTDIDTLLALIDHMLQGAYIVRINGTEFQLDRYEHDDYLGACLRVAPLNEFDEPYGSMLIPISDIKHIHIY